MNSADIIRKQIQKAANKDPEYKVFGAQKHKYQLNPVTTIEKIRQFEQKYSLKLPEEYVFFLTQVGNGGAGPYYGLYSLEEVEKYNMDYQQEPEVEALIDVSLSREKWNKAVCEMEDSDEKYDEILRRIAAGILVIGTQGCTYDNLLMCRGSESGKMVYIDWNLEEDAPPFLTGMSFLDWYEGYFKEIAEGNQVTSYGYRMLGTESELWKAYARTEEVQEKRKILLSFYRFGKLSRKNMHFLSKLEGDSLDSLRVELLMKHHISLGMKAFEQLLYKTDPAEAIQCARRMPEEYKEKYYSRMLELLYNNESVDKEKILFFLNDCPCKQASDLAAYAMDEESRDEKSRKTTVYIMGNCEDAETYIEQFIILMRGDSYWLAHTALQAVIRRNLDSPELRETFHWMKIKYENDSVMQNNLSHAKL